jgi:hypothetical protein
MIVIYRIQLAYLMWTKVLEQNRWGDEKVFFFLKKKIQNFCSSDE